jgi:hypothetical protein
VFRQGVVLRVREVGDGDDDATVKLRPCRRSQLAESWLGAEKGDGWKFRVEQDWAGSRQTLSGWPEVLLVTVGEDRACEGSHPVK